MRFGADEGGESGRNIISPECKSITPKVIMDFDYVVIKFLRDIKSLSFGKRQPSGQTVIAVSQLYILPKISQLFWS
jgi:hypothetical protein